MRSLVSLPELIQFRMSNRFALFVWCCLLSLVHCDVVFNPTRISSPRDGLSLIEAGSHLYFVGGFEFHDSIATDTIEVFDLINRTWSKSVNLPFKRGYVTPVALGKSLYFVGGYSYSNPPFVFDQERQDFLTDHGQGPTVFYPTSISLYQSTLTVIGSYSVDFLDLTKRQWNYSMELTQIKMELFNSISFVYEDIVVVIGGTNVTTLEDSLSAWLYNRTTDTLTGFKNSVSRSDSTKGFQYNVVNQIMAIWTSDIIHLHRLGTTDWHSPAKELNTITAILSTPMTTLIFNSGTYQEFFWTNMTLGPQKSLGLFQYAFDTDGYVAYVDTGPFGTNVYYYDDTSYSWVQWQTVNLDNFNGVQFSVSVGEWTCLATKTNVLAMSIQQNAYAVATSLTEVSTLMAGNRSCHFIDLGTPARRSQLFFEGENTVLVPQEDVTAIATPVAVIGNKFFTANGGVFYDTVTSQNFNQSSEITADHLWTSNDQQFVMMRRFDLGDSNIGQARQQYNKVDIFDTESQMWLNSTDMPFTDYDPGWYLPATALGDKLVVWYKTIAVYDPLTGNWTQSSNYTLEAVNDSNALLNAHIPVLTLNDTAYVRTTIGSFTKHRASDPFDWSETARVQFSDSMTFFVQYLYIGNNQIFISTRQGGGGRVTPTFSTNYIYDIERDYYQTYLVPPIGDVYSEDLTMLRVGDFVVSFSTNPTQILYFEISTGSWYMQDYASSVKLSAVYQTTTGLSVVVGGRDDNRGSTYSDIMLTFEADSISVPPISPTASNRTVGPPTGLSEGSLIAAIVVPVGVALIAGVLLLVLLLRKRRRQKKGRGAMSMTGLALKYGQWFIPFDQIKFGDQIGRGSSGQVFKGSWNGTSVALKVSMTQANSTVIGELEMMIQMRPHPNVVQLFGFSVHPETDSIILVIEFCDGGSLDDILFDSSQPMSSDQKTLLLLGVAKGLNHLHSNNIVHRDVASRNVLLHKNEPKLTDFGMSRLIDEDTQRGTTKSELGPIRWMSPESLRNKEYSTKSDVWSFGVLMYEVLAQQEPHVNEDPIEIGRLIRDNGLTPVIPESCPNKLADIMRSCWNVDASGRPAIEEIIEQLEVQ